MNLENRIPPPLVLLATGLAMWPVATLPPVLPGSPLRTVIAATLLAAGLVVTLLGVARFRAAGTTIDPTHPERAAQLVVDGIYRFTRNPMYLGFATILLAWALQLASSWALAGPLLFVWFIDRYQIAPEERALRAKFADAFDAYVRSVRRWL
jgi:protein-S-isoprenylcysteine O-methyltransferase Ste14